MRSTICAVTSSATLPLGSIVQPEGVTFNLAASDAAFIELLLFDDCNAPRPAQRITLDPALHRTEGYWHVSVPGLRPGQVYGYRVHGPFAPHRGLRFDSGKLVLDPYGLAVAVPDGYSRAAACRSGDNTPCALRSVVVDPTGYDWEGDRPLRRPFADTVLYELHVRGFTRHASSGLDDERRGTYAGVIAKIPYLRDLGITAVQLLPVFQFDPFDAPTGQVNYWGYQPISFFAPHHAYSSRRTPLGAVDECRDMVKALHRAGIEVILDAPFDHTAEGDERGPTLCYRGLANDKYYLLGRDPSGYANYTGCGNTLNAAHPIVRRLIQDSLRYWVSAMHIDGFRLDLTALLGRDAAGRPIPEPSLLRDLESDPVLSGTKLILEGTAAAGITRTAGARDTWREWSGRFRDDVRVFLRGDDDGVGVRLAARLVGGGGARGPFEAETAIDFITSHDGFTLNDLVSYGRPQDPEAAAAEQRTDGHCSWNCGVEGPTADPAVESLRNRQVKNFLALQLLGAGTPMLLMGDELRRTQCGHANPYCHDDEISWLDWSLERRHGDILRFVRGLNANRHRREAGPDGDTRTLGQLLRQARVTWHGAGLGQPDWSGRSHTLAFTLRNRHSRFLFHAMLNAGGEPLAFDLPHLRPRGESTWRRCIDTALPAPDDVQPWTTAPAVGPTRYLVQPHSVVLLALERQDSGGSPTAELA